MLDKILVRSHNEIWIVVTAINFQVILFWLGMTNQDARATKEALLEFKGVLYSWAF